MTGVVSLRSYSTRIEHKGYQDLIKNSEWEIIDRICQSELKCSAQTLFPNHGNEVFPQHIRQMLSRINEVTTFPFTSFERKEDDACAIYFKENETFVNLPYGHNVTSWIDRNAVQELIRSNFTKLFHPEDLVVIPGCAEGQIPIEVAAHSIMHDCPLQIVASDYNVTAMNIGYLTMKSYGIDPSRVSWVQSDVTKKSFFQSIYSTYPSRTIHKIVTLVQPCLKENALLSFLMNSSLMSNKQGVQSTLIMPVLLMDENSGWYKRCNGLVNTALDQAKKNKSPPHLIWQEQKYGVEFLKLSDKSYVPLQYFVYPWSIKELQEESGFHNATFEDLDISGPFHEETGGFQILEGISKRVICMWDSGKPQA